jgi:hypothetical protein
MTQRPISIFKYDGGTVYFTDDRTNEDYQMNMSDSELEEFTMVDSPCDIYDVYKWCLLGGFVPEPVIDFILHSRKNWRLHMEVENAN